MIGFNLTQNQVIHPERYNENCLWINGKIHPLPPVSFSRPHGVDNTWLIKDEYGMVDIEFTPEAAGKGDMNLLVLKAYYRGPVGGFKGFIRDSGNKRHPVDGCFGMGELKRLRM